MPSTQVRHYNLNNLALVPITSYRASDQVHAILRQFHTATFLTGDVRSLSSLLCMILVSPPNRLCVSVTSAEIRLLDYCGRQQLPGSQRLHSGHQR